MPPSSATGSPPRCPRTGSSSSSRVTGSGSGTGLVWSNPTLPAERAGSQSAVQYDGNVCRGADRHGAHVVGAAVAAGSAERIRLPAGGVHAADGALAADLANPRVVPEVEY